MKLVIFSICKDEGATIGRLLDLLPKNIEGIDEIVKLVISDGSSDDTAKIARQHGAKVVEGISQKRLAYRFAQALELVLGEGADIAVNIDGDLQFNPADIPKLIKPIVQNGYDFVAADRFTDPKTSQVRRPKNMPASKYYANRLGAWVVGKLTGYRFPDVTCGFRAYNRRALLALNINSTYTYTQESFQILAMKKMEIVSVPVKVTYFKDRKSRVVTNFSQFLFGSTLNILRAFRDFAPLKFFGLLGLVPFVPGFLALVIVGQHWQQTGAFSPYKAVGLVGIYLVTVAFILWFLGLVADMLNRVVNNQEKILEQLKKSRWPESE